MTRDKLNIDTEEIFKKLLELRSEWVSRSDDFPFFTLGPSSYFEGITGGYEKEAKRVNPILVKNFRTLYTIVSQFLKKRLGESIYIEADKLSVPGFHIFPSSEIFLTHSGPWHVDIPHETLKLGKKDTSTFVLPIKLPTGGGGMDLIDPHGNEYFEGYNEGEIIHHDGKTPHRIAGYKKFVPDEYRVTVQGHLVRRKGKMTMFW
jgi:hypothetical protein